MHYVDRIYGAITIDEPILIALIQSPALARLKHIDQAGYFEPYVPGSSHSRFEHSVGVYILLKKYGAPLLEQIAGLIHDVSHTAFSHCADYIFDEASQKTHSYQDSVFASYVASSAIPAILKTHGIHLTEVMDEKQFPLKEKPLPDLCADRIDYSLRTAFMYKVLNKRQIQDILQHLKVIDNQWVFSTVTYGQLYASVFRHLNTTYYSGVYSAMMFATVGEYLKYALRKKYIIADDLYTTDKRVLRLINAHKNNDKQLNVLWKRMNRKHPGHLDSMHYDAHVFCKSRIVDPLCFLRETVTRLSTAHPKWQDVVKQEMQPKEYFLKWDE